MQPDQCEQDLQTNQPYTQRNLDRHFGIFSGVNLVYDNQRTPAKHVVAPKTHSSEIYDQQREVLKKQGSKSPEIDHPAEEGRLRSDEPVHDNNTRGDIQYGIEYKREGKEFQMAEDQTFLR